MKRVDGTYFGLRRTGNWDGVALVLCLASSAFSNELWAEDIAPAGAVAAFDVRISTELVDDDELEDELDEEELEEEELEEEELDDEDDGESESESESLSSSDKSIRVAGRARGVAVFGSTPEG